MKKILCKIILVIISICCLISFFMACGNHQDIQGTIIAKSDEIQSKYKSTKKRKEASMPYSSTTIDYFLDSNPFPRQQIHFCCGETP